MIDLSDLEQIIAILRQSDVTEFELEKDGTHIRLVRSASGFQAQGQAQRIGVLEPAIIGSANGQSGPATEPASVDLGKKLTKVESPIVGTFFRKPSPDAEPFVNVGDLVKKGDTLCIIEAMKLMNEIESPCSGRVEKILLDDGGVVEFGEVILLINPDV